MLQVRVHLNKLDMLTLAKIMLDLTLKPEGRLLLPEPCHHVAFPRGLLSLAELLCGCLQWMYSKNWIPDWQCDDSLILFFHPVAT